MLSLYSRKIVILLGFIAALSLDANGQYYGKNVNFQEYRNKSYYFGITLGLNTSRHFTLRSRQFIGNDSISVLQGNQGLGFNINGIVNFKLGNNFDLRFLPGFAFTTRTLEFDSFNNLDDTALEQRELEAILVKFPFHVRYKSAPFKDKRAFVVGGISYAYDVASNEDVREELAKNLIQVSPHDFQFEIGVGMQFFTPYFIFSPEIKFSQGLNNILIYNAGHLQSSILDQLTTRTFTISFHIEG